MSAVRLADLPPRDAPEALAGSREPFLVGVRHHSAALAAAMPRILASFEPTVLLIELPADLGGWLPWLASPELLAPVALSATAPDGSLSFYPFADFSPELAALRWAREAGVPVEAIDRPVSARVVHGPDDSPRSGRLLARLEGGHDTEELWDTMVEARAPGSPEALRRAALSFGWLLRADTLHGGGIAPEDAAREGHMRACAARAVAIPGARVCCVVGAFHANALLKTPVLEAAPTTDVPPRALSSERVGALVPYDFELLDSRSGYPAGIRDPSLVQRAFELFSVGEALDAALPSLLVTIARELRERGHVASFADVREAARVAHDLASLRGLGSPGRRELLETIETTMAQGEPLGRGRVLAQALSVVLVGHRRGRLPEDAPRAGLVVAANAQLDELGMPGPEGAKDPKEMTLDPERSQLDRRRAIVLGQLAACGIPYAEKRGSARAVGGARADVESLTVRVSLRYTPETAARLEIAGLFGSTLGAAAEGSLRRSFAALESDGKSLAEGWLDHVARAANAGLGALVGELLDRVPDVLLPNASLSELAAATMLVARLDEGHVAALPSVPSGSSTRSLAPERDALLFASLRALLGIVGTTSEDDVRAFAELLSLFADHDVASLEHAVATFVSEGSPLMKGAGLAARVLLDLEAPERFFETFVSLFDLGGADASSAAIRTGTLRGALLLAGPIFEGHPRFASAVTEGLEALDDARFLERLPSLRGAFDVLSAGDRQRLLDVLGSSFVAVDLTVTPEELGVYARADRAGAEALLALGLAIPGSSGGHIDPGAEPSRPETAPARHNAIGLRDRLRLVLGREASALAPGHVRYARALDELYGHGHGEGSRGGTGESYPTAREWGDELRELFGEAVREEVLGSAAAGGQGAAIGLLDPEKVTPSIELLEQILSLKGGLSERDFVHLKLLAKRVVEALVKELATRTLPALTGLATPRASRRRSGLLDLRRTIESNLATAYVHEGAFRLAPRRFVFRARARKSLDWRIVLVVDVSGSMEPSVLHSAMMAAILGSLPAVSTHFLAVSDRVVDLSHQAADPLELLLSVRIGGGTLLSKGLRHARSLLTVPSRSIVVLVSDFEEGGSVAELLSEARALRDAGATLLGLAALGERNAPRYHRAIAERLVGVGMPIAALSPLELARWVGEKLRGAT
ncbi:MAG: VWA domain-containing protein [Deltaproteobacteria bacterium]|nr:VWA domain-containing protein [Deltaproteobacteria bacterium]